MSVKLKDFLGALRVPPSSFPALIAAFLLLGACNYTYTWTLPAGGFDTRLRARLARLALGLPALYLFYCFAYSDYGAQGRLTTIGMAVIGIYGIMQVLGTAFVGLWDLEPPRWISLSTGEVKPMPSTIVERVVYSFDLTTSLRGTSWLPDTDFNFAPRTLRAQQQRIAASDASRWTFVARALRRLGVLYVVVDACDALNKGRAWDTRLLHPVTSLPWLSQLPYTLSVCVGTITSIVVEHSIVMALCLAAGARPEAWPPMFNAPFSSVSLADLWTRRWHAIFRRSFDRLAIPALWLVPQSAGIAVRGAVRALVVFFLSATLHVLLMHRLETDEDFVHPHFWDTSVLKFFLAQPVCLIIERFVVMPVARRTLPPHLQTVPTRIFVWACLLFTGRYWADVWVRRGLWGPPEKVVGFSVVRGLWKGEWFV